MAGELSAEAAREIRHLQKSKEKSRRLHNASDAAAACNRLGELLASQGRYEEALEEHREELRLLEGAGDPLGCAVAHRKIGERLAELRRFQAALQHQRQHLSLAQELADPAEQQRAWATIGRTFMFMAEDPQDPQDPQGSQGSGVAALLQAQEAFQTSLDIVDTQLEGQLPGREVAAMRSRLFLNLGLVRDSLGDPGNGCRELLGESARLAEQWQLLEDQFRAHFNLGLLQQRGRDLRGAQRSLERARDCARRLRGASGHGAGLATESSGAALESESCAALGQVREGTLLWGRVGPAGGEWGLREASGACGGASGACGGRVATGPGWPQRAVGAALESESCAALGQVREGTLLWGASGACGGRAGPAGGEWGWERGASGTGAGVALESRAGPRSGRYGRRLCCGGASGACGGRVATGPGWPWRAGPGAGLPWRARAAGGEWGLRGGASGASGNGAEVALESESCAALDRYGRGLCCGGRAGPVGGEWGLRGASGACGTAPGDCGGPVATGPGWPRRAVWGCPGERELRRAGTGTGGDSAVGGERGLWEASGACGGRVGPVGLRLATAGGEWPRARAGHGEQRGCPGERELRCARAGTGSCCCCGGRAGAVGGRVGPAGGRAGPAGGEWGLRGGEWGLRGASGHGAGLATESGASGAALESESCAALGQVFLALGDFGAARRALRRALALGTPGHPQSRQLRHSLRHASRICRCLSALSGDSEEDSAREDSARAEPGSAGLGSGGLGSGGLGSGGLGSGGLGSGGLGSGGLGSGGVAVRAPRGQPRPARPLPAGGALLPAAAGPGRVPGGPGAGAGPDPRLTATTFRDLGQHGRALEHFQRELQLRSGEPLEVGGT
ncbi:uncharacterized protein ACIQIH_002062, partial [Cyanocitta cristata]